MEVLLGDLLGPLYFRISSFEHLELLIAKKVMIFNL